MNPSELADELVTGPDCFNLDRDQAALLAAALRLADAASDPNFHRLELGRLREAYKAVKEAV